MRVYFFAHRQHFETQLKLCFFKALKIVKIQISSGLLSLVILEFYLFVSSVLLQHIRGYGREGADSRLQLKLLSLLVVLKARGTAQ